MKNLAQRIATVKYEQALECLRKIAEKHINIYGEAPPFMVVVGGTALAAHGLREMSTDVDYYSPEIDETIVMEVEAEMKQRLGDQFKIDATQVETLWGPIMFRDIESKSEDDRTLEVNGHTIPIKKLSLNDLTLIKIVANREKDRADLELLRPQIDADSLIERFNTIVKWYGERGGQHAFADKVVEFITKDSDISAEAVIDRLAVPTFVKEMLKETRSDGYDI